MGRAPLGSAAKTKTAGVRLTDAENKKFIAKWGSAGKFLQQKVAEELRIMDAESDAKRIDPRQVMK